MKLKKFLAMSLTVVMTTSLLVGCSSTKPESKGESSTKVNSRKENNELVVSVGSEPEGLDPTTGGHHAVTRVFFSTLLTRDKDMKIKNDLATEYNVSDDKLTWTVKIRDDAKFTDGNKLTAQDVAYTFETAGKSASVVDLTSVESIKAVDEYTVEFKLKEPQSTFVNKLINIGIVPKGLHNDKYATNPVTSGPYKFVQWDKGQQIIVEANEDYYGEKPSIKKLTMLFLDSDAALAALKSDEVDMASIPASFADQKIDGKVLREVDSIENLGITFPTVKSGKKTKDKNPIGNDVTSDLAIRQAINYGIDRNELVEGVLSGYGTPSYVGLEAMPWYNSEVEIKDGDIEKAKKILADAGWKDSDNDGIVEKNGLKAEFKLCYIMETKHRQEMALAVSEKLKEIGINAVPEARTWDNAMEVLHSEPVILGWGEHDPALIFQLFHSKNSGVDWYNTGFYKNEKVDEYINKAMTSKSEEEALEFWKKAQWDGKTGIAPVGDAPWAWLTNVNHLFIMNKDLDIGTPKPQPHGGAILENITEWKWK